MEKELLNSDKELLLKELCGRLPYGVKVHTSLKPICTIFSKPTIYSTVVIDGAGEEVCNISDIKPYLFPLSSMTPKQKAELSMLVVGVEDIFKSFLIEVEFYHKHHIDYRGLIPMGLAIDATGLNIY